MKASRCRPVGRGIHGYTAISVAVRIMAEAGALPEEFKIKKLLEAAKQNYRAAENAEARHVAMALIADLQQRYNVAIEARRRFMSP